MTKRRIFIKKILGLFIFIPLTNNIGFSNIKNEHNITQKFISMGTIGKINIITENKKNGIKAINDILNKILYLEKNLTMFSTKSFIGKLNANQNKEFIIPNYILYILKISEIIKTKTNKKFDIGIGNNIYFKKYTKSLNKNNQIPSINIKKNKIMLSNNFIIDLGGIGKGFAIEEAMKIANQYKIENALIELGGDIKAIGKKYNTSWKIKINSNSENLKNNYININNESLASSGQFIKNTITNKYELKKHIIDPKSLSSKEYYKLTTVLGPNATICDALATACYNTPIQEMNILQNNFKNYTFKTLI